MGKLFAIHPDNPQSRIIRKAVQCVEEGGLIAYPTDSGYALGCSLGNKNGLERIRRLRQLDSAHNMTLVCRDLSNLSIYARFSKPIFRMLKAFTPGPYTFILNATSEVPRLMMHPKRRTLGIRVPDNAITLMLLEYLDAPLMSTSLLLPESHAPISEPDAIKDLLGGQIDLIIDGGNCGYEPTTIVDLTGDVPTILREGKGDSSPFKNWINQ